MKRFIIVQPIPKYMERTSRQPEAQLTAKMENLRRKRSLVSWYRYVSEDKKLTHEITEALKKSFYGLVFLKFSDLSEEETVLSWGIADEVSNYKPIEYRFYEIADGERALIALYTLIYVARSKNMTLCIENPTDFIALPVIRPWLTLLQESCRDG